MSRSINVNVGQAQVLGLCEKHGAAISAIETLHAGGTRVVFKNPAAAAAMSVVFGSKLIAGDPKRVPNRLMRR